MRKVIIIFLALAFSLQAQNYFGHGQTQPSTTFSDSVKVGSSTNYINLTPASVGGMLNITAGSAANWTGLKISGAGFNNSSDNYIQLGTSYTWKADGSLSTAKLVATDSARVEKTAIIKGAITANDKIMVEDSITVGQRTTLDNVLPYFRMKGDADSDPTAVTRAEYSLTLVPAADPASAYWYATSTYNRYWWGTANDYIFKTPTSTAGMLTLNAATSGDWSGIVFSGAAWNDNNDKYINISSTNYWSPTLFSIAQDQYIGRHLYINQATSAGEDPVLQMKFDGDSDAGDTVDHTYIMSGTAAADPANTYLDHTVTSNKFRWGGATDYISMEPANTAGMLNIVQTASGNWSGLKITGAGFNNSSDKFIDISTNNFWRGDGVLNTQSNINAVGNISSQDGTITINSVAADGEHTQDLIMNADMSSGAGVTADELRVSATPASDPTQGAWDMTITQALGLRLNKGLSVGSGDFISKWTKNTGGDSLFFICGTDTFVCVRK